MSLILHCRAQRSLHEPARHLLQSTETLLGAAEEAPASLGSLLAAGPPAAPVNASSHAQIEEAGASSGSSTALAKEPATAAILQGVPTGGAPEQAPASAPEQAVLAPAEAPPQLVLLPVDNLQTPAVRAAAAAAAAAEEAAAALGPASVAETEELASNPVERSLPQVGHGHVVVQGSWAPPCQHRSSTSCLQVPLLLDNSHQDCAQGHQAEPATWVLHPNEHLQSVPCQLLFTHALSQACPSTPSHIPRPKPPAGSFTLTGQPD